MARINLKRVEHDKDYITIKLQCAKDKSLSLQATGLHLLLWVYGSIPEWELNYSHLLKSKTNGATSLKSAIKELKKLGYLEIKSIREKGKIKEWEWTIYEVPPDVCNPQVQNVLVDNVLVENVKGSNNKISNNKINIIYNKKKRVFSNLTDKDFKIWNKAYPGVDFRHEINEAIAWLDANPKRANKRNWKRFLCNWFSSEYDKIPKKANGLMPCSWCRKDKPKETFTKWPDHGVCDPCAESEPKWTPD